MIVECKNCLKKFTIKDSDIPSKGRTVQCGNCSSRWLQMPTYSEITTDNFDVEKKSFVKPIIVDCNKIIDIAITIAIKKFLNNVFAISL